jgi:hypothetical protein
VPSPIRHNLGSTDGLATIAGGKARGKIVVKISD